MCKLREKDETNDAFPYEHLVSASHDLIMWFTNFSNYLESDLVSLELTYHQRKKFMHNVKKFFWDETYLYLSCVDGILR